MAPDARTAPACTGPAGMDPARPAASRTARRPLLLGLLAAPLVPRRAGAAQVPGTARLMTPGPEGSALAQWAERFCAGLTQGAGVAGAGTRLEAELLGGPDGVTAANRFATTAAPDGRTLLLLPGPACQARLVGDPRARFNPAGWLPVCARAAPAILAGRGPLPAGAGRAPLRLALPGPDHPAAAALLGLDLLGVAAVPVLGVAPAQAEAALAGNMVDAAVLQGADAPARIAGIGARPWFALGEDGVATGLPRLAAAPGAGAPRALQLALDGAGTAAELSAALVLPALTPADMVAFWRGAVQRWMEAEVRQAGEAAPRVLAGPEAATLLGVLAPPPAAMQAYQDWLKRRLNWRAA